MDLGNRREDYLKGSLDIKDVDNDPFVQFEKWYRDAETLLAHDVNAMTLATANTDGIPSARIVLLKQFDSKGFVFFSNYESHKAHDMAENPNVALVFLWKEMQRQIRICGKVEKISREESLAYFHTRPHDSQIGSWCSPQSKIIASRSILDQNEAKYNALFPDEVDMPPFWGGYRVIPRSIEFWQGRHGRLHDRLQYLRVVDNLNDWNIERLAP